jgi:hypothetical protein
MKTLLLLFIATISFFANAQTPSEQMEKRAREMHRVILLSDKEAWRKFIKENYTQTLIDKPMRQSVQTSEDKGSGASTKTQTSTAENLEAKVGMYARLHEDFKTSKITLIKPITDGLEMTAEAPDGMVGVFTLRFDKTSNLIDGLGIQVEAR